MLCMHLRMSIKKYDSQVELNEDQICRIIHVMNSFSDIFFEIDIRSCYDWLQ